MIERGGGGVRAVTGFLLGFWLIATVAEGPLAALVGPEVQVLDRINAVRSEHHLNRLSGSPDLARVAEAHARDMARRGYLSHVNPDGENPLDRARAAGLKGFRLLAENIARSSVQANQLDEVMREWLASPLHRENLLNPTFNTTGIGIVETTTGDRVYVQIFATY